MKVGIFADSHDHLDNIRRVVELFNELECECVLFAGDLVSTFAVPPLRKLNCRLLGCYGDNEGNKPGLQAGMSIVGDLREAPALYTLGDGTRVVLVHMERQLRGFEDPFDVCVYGHTHKPRVSRDERGRLFINPGETSGWTFGRPSAAVLDTASMQVEILDIRSTPTSADASEHTHRASADLRTQMVAGCDSAPPADPPEAADSRTSR